MGLGIFKLIYYTAIITLLKMIVIVIFIKLK
jgi:hypothetical protein